MATKYSQIYVSPGVYFETLDYSLYAPILTKTIYALVGKFKKGPIEPTYITNPRQFIETFGIPERGMFSTYSAIAYLEQSPSLWVQRLVGPNAKKAAAELSKGQTITKEKILKSDGVHYLFSGRLDFPPIPGTIQMEFGDQKILDDEHGNLIGPAILKSPHFINYDSGVYQFTFSAELNDNYVINAKFNKKLFNIKKELITFGADDTADSLHGILNHTKIIKNDNFILTVTNEANVTREFIFHTDDPVAGIAKLVEKADTLTDKGTLNLVTGEYTINYTGDNWNDKARIYVNYDYESYKVKNLYTKDPLNPDQPKPHVFMGNLGSNVLPNTLEIIVVNGTDEHVVASDNGVGYLIKKTNALSIELKEVTNKVNYETGEFNFALPYPLVKDTELVVDYVSKFSQVLHIVTSTDGKNYSGVLTGAPITRKSIHIKIDTVELTDDGEGSLNGPFGNGTIDYLTGEIAINLLSKPNDGTPIIITYLRKFGNVIANSHGDWANGIKVQLTHDYYTGYSFNIWNPGLDPMFDQATELFTNITFDSVDDVNFYENKIFSNLVYIVPVRGNKPGDKPIVGNITEISGGFNDFDNISVDQAIEGIKVFQSTEEYNINLICCPDFPGNKRLIQEMLDMCKGRGDCFAIIDPPQGMTPKQIVDWTNGEGKWASQNVTGLLMSPTYKTKNAIDSRFGALYYPWLRIYDKFTNSYQTVPPSTRIPAVWAFSDNVSDPWFAPAGLNRGKVFDVVGVERKLSLPDRDMLYGYPNIVNPILDMPSEGVVVWGQKTCQRKPTALDRIGPNRLLHYAAKVLSTSVNYLVFDPNDDVTRIKYINTLNPVFEEVKQRRGLYEFKIVCDMSNNTTDNIEVGEMIGDIILQPTKSAERIINRFILTKTGVSLDSFSSSDEQ